MILALVLLVVASIWINKYNLSEETDSAFAPNGAADDGGGFYKPPIDAKDEAGRFIQQASENYFFHEFVKGAENYRKAIAIYEAENKIPQVARTYESLGDLYKFANEVKEAEGSYLKAVSYHTQIEDSVGEGRALMHVGDLYQGREQMDTAGEWYKKAGAAVEGAKPHRDLAKVHEAIGHYYWKVEDLPSAIDHFKQAQATFAALKSQTGYDHITKVLGLLKKKSKAAESGQQGLFPSTKL